MSFRKTITTFALPLLLVLFFISPALAQVNPSPDFDPHKIIVKLKPASNLLTRNAADVRMARVKQLRPLKSVVGDRTHPLAGGVERIFVAEIADGENLEEVLRQLAADPAVEYAERDYIMRADDAAPRAVLPAPVPPLNPGDPFFGQQWGLQNTGQYFGGYSGTPGMDINAVRAWDISTGESSTVLAILDSGIVFNSLEFEGRLLSGYDFVNGDNRPVDDFGHGTKIAGIAAATGGNGFLIAGVNWKCRILPVKILDAKGNGSYDAFAQGIIFAADQGARVASISAGGTGASATLLNAIQYAQSHGMVIVASIGNNNAEFPARYPAAYPGVIAVGAINNMGLRAAPFSCSGTGGSNYGDYLAFMAPGDQILSLDYNDPTLLANPPGCGTSDAVPYVSGLISLMFGINSALTYDQVYAALKAAARDQIGSPGEDTPGWDKYYGWGLIDAYRTLQALPEASRIYFAQVAIGGGYTTTFTLMNTGTQQISGKLILTADDGLPLTAAFSSPGQSGIVAAIYPIKVPAGGTQLVVAGSPGLSPTSMGWARVDSSAASLQGVATFQLVNNGKLATIAGVLSADAASSATIPVNDDRTLGSQSCATGYAVANPGPGDIHVRILIYDAFGKPSQSLDPPMLNPLKPGTHVARFLWEDLGNPSLSFKGSMVLVERDGRPFSVVALVLNQGLYTAVPVIPGTQSGTAAAGSLLAQVALGGGFTTAFTVVNTGNTTASGSLILTDDLGQPLNASFSSSGMPGGIGSSYPIEVAAGGAQFFAAGAVNPATTTAVGWARIDGSNHSLAGLATFQLYSGGTLATIAGVLSANATSSAAIPVNDDRTLGTNSYITGYAVANPGADNVNIRITVFKPDGSILKAIDPPLLNPLRPGWHAARFLWEDLGDPALKFTGSMTLTEQSGKNFSVVALVLNQGLWTAIPVIPLK